MADLEVILASGDITDIHKGGIGVPEEVPNNSEVDVRIAASEATRVPLVDAPQVQFDPTVSSPAWAEGTLFYDNVHKCLAFYNSVDGITIQLSQELVGRAYNDTGVTIPNGTPVKLTGPVDPVTKTPAIEPAIADSFVNARVIGVATHDIVDGGFGFVTGRGEIHDIDTSAFTDGDRLYLSDTVAGGFTLTPPDIVTFVGVVIYAHATEGVISINPEPNMALPTTIGLIQGKVGTMNLTTSYQNVVGYTEEDSVVTPVDALAGTISPVSAGRYRVTVNMTLTVPSAVATRTILLQCWDTTHSEQFAISSITVPRDATQVSRSFSKVISVDANDVLILRLQSSVSISGVIFDDISFDIVALSVSS